MLRWRVTFTIESLEMRWTSALPVLNSGVRTTRKWKGKSIRLLWLIRQPNTQYNRTRIFFLDPVLYFLDFEIEWGQVFFSENFASIILFCFASTSYLYMSQLYFFKKKRTLPTQNSISLSFFILFKKKKLSLLFLF